jgi:hypothetical protein
MRNSIFAIVLFTVLCIFLIVTFASLKANHYTLDAFACVPACGTTHNIQYNEQCYCAASQAGE